MAEDMRPLRNYKDAIRALNALQLNYALIEATRKLGPNVDRNQLLINEVYEYCRRLGYQPQDFDRLNIIHVTGTKGKGLTCAFAELILGQYRGHGRILKVGLFTLPHLKLVRERIRIDGAPISELKFARYFFEVYDKLSLTTSDPNEFPTLQPSNEVKPMYFKYLTLLLFHVFMSEGVDTAIYEVGVGGEYDSTNIIQHPTATGISTLGIDHTFMLGDNIKLITWNKTGIFKQGSPAFVSPQPEYPDLIPIIEERAKERQVSELVFVDPDQVLPPDQKLGLAGDFQRNNAALAVSLVDAHLRKLGYQGDDVIEDGHLPDQFSEGLDKAEWPGRCQTILNKPERINWYIDGAHTLELMAQLLRWFVQQMEPKKKQGLRVLLFNQQLRENADDLLVTLYNTVYPNCKFDHVIFTTNITWSDGKYDDDLVLMNTLKKQVDEMVIQKQLAQVWALRDASTGNNSRKHIFPDIETGVNFIKLLTSLPDYAPAASGEVDVFVCGSLHLVGGFLVVLDGDKEQA